jgi:putative acetyltransferase
VSLVAEQEGEVVGHILVSDLPIITSDGVVRTLSLAPMAVVPSRKRQGIARDWSGRD